MKPTINIRNMKKLAMTSCAALIFAAAGFTQSSTEAYPNDVKASLGRLEMYMNSAEQTAKYVAPAVVDVTDESDAMQKLELLAAATEEALKYSAPAVNEENEAYAADETSPEIERLEMMAAATEESLRYKAPEVNELPEIEIEQIKANYTIILLAQETAREMR
jgi:hypothetical protein